METPNYNLEDINDRLAEIEQAIEHIAELVMFDILMKHTSETQRNRVLDFDERAIAETRDRWVRLIELLNESRKLTRGQ